MTAARKRAVIMTQNVIGETAPHAFVRAVHGVRYQVKDVARSAAFYTQYLGFTLKHQQLPAFANVALGDAQILLSGPGASGSRPMPDGQQQEPGGWNRVVLKVADLPGFVAELKKAGLHFRNEMETGPGGRQIQIEDPTGIPSNCSNRLAIRDSSLRREFRTGSGPTACRPPALSRQAEASGPGSPDDRGCIKLAEVHTARKEPEAPRAVRRTGRQRSTTGWRRWCEMACAIASNLSRLPTAIPCRRTCRVTMGPSLSARSLPESTPISEIVPPLRTARSDWPSVCSPRLRSHGQTGGAIRN